MRLPSATRTVHNGKGPGRGSGLGNDSSSHASSFAHVSTLKLMFSRRCLVPAHFMPRCPLVPKVPATAACTHPTGIPTVRKPSTSIQTVGVTALVLQLCCWGAQQPFRQSARAVQCIIASSSVSLAKPRKGGWGLVAHCWCSQQARQGLCSRGDHPGLSSVWGPAFTGWCSVYVWKTVCVCGFACVLCRHGSCYHPAGGRSGGAERSIHQRHSKIGAPRPAPPGRARGAAWCRPKRSRARAGTRAGARGHARRARVEDSDTVAAAGACRAARARNEGLKRAGLPQASQGVRRREGAAALLWARVTKGTGAVKTTGSLWEQAGRRPRARHRR